MQSSTASGGIEYAALKHIGTFSDSGVNTSFFNAF